MFGVYLFALIYGFGILLIDLLGLIGTDDSGETDGGDEAGDDSGTSGDSGDDGLNADDDAVVLPDNRRHRFVYRALNVLRATVYFAVGFGAVGVFGHATGRPVVISAPWAVGTGLILLILVRLIMRLQNRVVDSQVEPHEMLLAEAEVLVTIPPAGMGRVRVRTGGSYHDVFAKGRDPERSYPAGEKVYVIDVSGNDPVVHTEKE